MWFAPTAKSMDQHNFYGNVSFVIEWAELLKKMGPYLYWIDQAIYNRDSYTRILLTKNRHCELVELDLYSDGWALKKEHNQNYYHIDRAYCKTSIGPHELQIGVEVTNADAIWAFQNCVLLANNHSSANTLARNQRVAYNGIKKKYAPYKCFRYNTAQNTECPDKYTKEETERFLVSMNVLQENDEDQENESTMQQTPQAHYIYASRNNYRQSNNHTPISGQELYDSDEERRSPIIAQRQINRRQIHESNTTYYDKHSDQEELIEAPSSFCCCS